MSTLVVLSRCHYGHRILQGQGNLYELESGDTEALPSLDGQDQPWMPVWIDADTHKIVSMKPTLMESQEVPVRGKGKG